MRSCNGYLVASLRTWFEIAGCLMQYAGIECALGFPRLCAGGRKQGNLVLMRCGIGREQSLADKCVVDGKLRGECRGEWDCTVGVLDQIPVRYSSDTSTRLPGG